MNERDDMLQNCMVLLRTVVFEWLGKGERELGGD